MNPELEAARQRLEQIRSERQSTVNVQDETDELELARKRLAQLRANPQEVSQETINLDEEPKKTFLEKASNTLGSIFGGKKIGEAIGTGIAKRKFERENQELAERDPEAFKQIEETTFQQPSARELAGDAVQIGANFIPAAKGGKLAAAIGRGAFGQALATGVKTGAATGAAVGFGASLQDEENDLGDIATDTLVGAGAGAALGVALPVAGKGLGVATKAIKGLGNLPEKAAIDIEDNLRGVFTGTKSAAKSYDKGLARQKDAASFLVERKIIPEVRNKKVYAKDAINTLNQEVEPLNDLLTEVLTERGKQTKPVVLKTLKEKIKDSVNNDVNKGQGIVSKLQQRVDDIFEEYEKVYGPEVPLDVLNQMKKGQWQLSQSFDASEPKFYKDVNYQIGKVLKEEIQDAFKDDLSIREFNDYIANYYDAMNQLQKVDGNAVKGGRLGGYFSRVIGGMAGSGVGLGPAGTLIGSEIGNQIQSILTNNSIASPFKLRLLMKLRVQNPQVVDDAIKTLYKMQQENAVRLQLPAAGQSSYREPTLYGTEDGILSTYLQEIADETGENIQQPSTTLKSMIDRGLQNNQVLYAKDKIQVPTENARDIPLQLPAPTGQYLLPANTKVPEVIPLPAGKRPLGRYNRRAE